MIARKFFFFDLDGTLADTDGDIRGAWKAALSDEGLVCPDFDAKFVAGPPFDEMVKILFPERCTPELVETLKNGFARHYDNDGFPTTREYPGIAALLRRLKADGATLAIVTNKRYVGAQAMSRHFGWDHIFDALYTGDMYPEGKLRKPELLARVLKDFSACAEECVMVGDTALDFEAARANGVLSIGVTWGYGRADELACADLTVSRAADIPAQVS